MDQKYLYVKQYVPTLSGTLHLTNPELALEYCNEKLNALLNATTHQEELNVKLEILRDFEEIYTFDCANAERSEPFGSFHDAKEKAEFINLKQLVEDFYLYVGNIFCSYHEKLLDRKKVPLLDFRPMVIDYNELYLKAVNEYYGALLGVEYPLRVFPVQEKDTAPWEHLHKNTVNYVECRGVMMPIATPVSGQAPERSPHAIATTFILPALIDHALLMHLQNKALFTGLNGVKDKLSQGDVLTEDERIIYDDFTQAKKAGRATFSGSKEQMMEKAYSMMIAHGVLQDDKDIKQVLMGKHMTLGSVLHSNYCESVIRPEYFQLLEYLFDTKQLNIRNCIMHGNSVTYDYLAIGIASVMLQLLWDIGSNDVFL